MSDEPTYGTTDSGLDVHAKASHYIGRAQRFRLSSLKTAIKEAEGFNAKLAVFITSAVGTMACAYLFALLALSSLPVILVQAGAVPASLVPHFLQKPGMILIVAWIAQTFLQLVLLSIIMVGQRVQSLASDARAEKTFEDTEVVMDRLDLGTEGGLKALNDKLDQLLSK